LVYLENKYNIQIQREKAIKNIPLSCKEYGQPFLSKFVSQFIEALQKHDFKWQDKPYEILIEEYPKAKSYVGWWCNLHENRENTYSSFNIAKYKGLKEFLISNPPSFKISPKCCEYSKKKVAETYAKKNKLDLFIIGIRKAEGGIRSVKYKSCFVNKGAHSYGQYFPIFWYKNQDKIDYEQLFDVTHSLCYNSYGLKRTGCAGCPFGSNFENELDIIYKYEQKLYKAVNNIFKDSYEYTRQYREFVKKL
jgi:hypothetical protein